MAALLFQNTTGRIIEGGSVQVIGQDHYLGETMLPTMTPSDEQMVPYAVEMKVEMSMDQETTKLPVHHVVIKNGTLSLFNYASQRTIYWMNNQSGRELALYINHYFTEGYEFQEDPRYAQPVDITDRVLQFLRTVSADSTEKQRFSVRERTTDRKELEIRSLTLKLDEYLEKGILTPEIVEQIKVVHKFENEANELTKQISATDGEIRDLESNQSRLRTNITTLQGHEEDSIQYIKDLKANEESLQALQATKKKLEAQRKTCRQSSTQAANRIDVTHTVESEPTGGN